MARIALAAIGLAVTAGVAVPTDAPAAPDPCSAAYPYFGVGNWPPACWRPYSPTSPFNKPIPPNPGLRPNSSRIVKRLLENGPAGPERAGTSDSGDDYDMPLYWARATDPVVTLHGSAPVEGKQIHLPQGAKPANGGDRHMTIVEPDGWEYDLWHADTPSGGRLSASTGRRLRIDGNGYGSGVVAARFGNLAGRVRAAEMAAGRIDHALMMTVECTSGAYVWPSVRAGSTCDDRVDAPSLGDRFQLAMSDGQIAALNVPPWKKTILRALARYGAYVGEETSRWSLLGFESGVSYTSFGYPDQLAQFARGAGVRQSGGVYYFDIASGLDWARYLRVIDPAVSRSSQPQGALGALRLSRLSVAPRRFRGGTRFRFRLSAPAMVTFSILRTAPGRRAKGQCRRPSRRLRSHRRCIRHVGVGNFSAAGKRGRNRKRFSGRLNGRRLRAGSYRAVVVASSATGSRSRAKRVRFKITR